MDCIQAFATSSFRLSEVLIGLPPVNYEETKPGIKNQILSHLPIHKYRDSRAIRQSNETQTYESKSLVN